MKFKLWRLNFMEIDRLRTSSCYNKFFMFYSNFIGLWWSQFELWRLSLNYRGSRRQKFKFERLHYIFRGQKYFELSVYFSEYQRFFKGKRQKIKIIDVFELLRFELVRFYCSKLILLLLTN
jgi:hypothetical protein